MTPLDAMAAMHGTGAQSLVAYLPVCADLLCAHKGGAPDDVRAAEGTRQTIRSVLEQIDSHLAYFRELCKE